MMLSFRKKILCVISLLGILLAVSACNNSSNDTGKTENYDEARDFSEEEYPPSDAPNDEEYMSPAEARAAMEDLYSYFWKIDTMTPERQAYRLSCICDGVNLSTNGGTGSMMQRYNDVMRDIWNMAGESIALSGTVVYVDRQGTYTNLLVQNPIWNFIVSAFLEDDLPVIQNDTITIFGECNGPATYTNTNEYGVAAECSTFGINIRDYYIGSADPIHDYKMKNLFDSSAIWQLGIDSLIEGAPILTEEERAYWYGTYQNDITLTENTITTDRTAYPYGTTHPYTVYSYSYDNSTGAYVMRFRYTEIADLYPEDTYSLLCLSYNAFTLITDEDVEKYLFSVIPEANNPYSYLLSQSYDNYVGNIRH